jgi:hypothetical protein
VRTGRIGQIFPIQFPDEDDQGRQKTGMDKINAINMEKNVVSSRNRLEGSSMEQPRDEIVQLK